MVSYATELISETRITFTRGIFRLLRDKKFEEYVFEQNRLLLESNTVPLLFQNKFEIADVIPIQSR